MARSTTIGSRGGPQAPQGLPPGVPQNAPQFSQEQLDFMIQSGLDPAALGVQPAAPEGSQPEVIQPPVAAPQVGSRTPQGFGQQTLPLPEDEVVIDPETGAPTQDPAVRQNIQQQQLAAQEHPNTPLSLIHI